MYPKEVLKVTSTKEYIIKGRPTVANLRNFFARLDPGIPLHAMVSIRSLIDTHITITTIEENKEWASQNKDTVTLKKASSYYDAYFAEEK